MRTYTTLFFFIILVSGTWAQSSFSSGVLPRIRVSMKISDNLKWVNGIESRQLLIDNTQEDELGYEYILTDFSTLLSQKIGSNISLNGGYLLRIEDNQVIHRSIQQFNFVQNIQTFRIGHRFVTDQTFNTNEAPQFRIRYRITAEKPLSGEKIDPGEFYVKFGNEYLGSFQSSESDLEIRLLPFLGYELNKTNKIEFGLDYRISNFLNSASENDLWISFNWYHTLDLRKK